MGSFKTLPRIRVKTFIWARVTSVRGNRSLGTIISVYYISMFALLMVQIQNRRTSFNDGQENWNFYGKYDLLLKELYYRYW